MDNVAHRAAEAYLSSSTLEPEKGVRIHIEKHVPVAAGLAGGSADAAAVLYGLNQMSNTPMSGPELLELGARVGSDVPFCLKGGTCLVKGRGDLVEQVTPWPKTYFIVVCPNFQVSTPWAYERFDQMHLEVSGKIKNDLEPVVVAEHEVVTEIKEKLVELGCSESQMSGSGPSVFGTVRHKTEAEEIFEKVKEEYPRTFLVETVDQGVSEA